MRRRGKQTGKEGGLAGVSEVEWKEKTAGLSDTPRTGRRRVEAGGGLCGDPYTHTHRLRISSVSALPAGRTAPEQRAELIQDQPSTG